MASKFDTWVASYAEFAIRRRWLVFTATGLLTAATSVGLNRIGFDTSYRIWFDPKSELLSDYDLVVSRFGGDDQAAIVFQDKEGLLRPPALESIRRLTDAFWKIPGVKRVDSLVNFPVMRGSRIDLESPALAISGERIAAAGDQNTVFVWGADGRLLHRLEGHEGLVEHLVFSADGKRLYSGSVDRTVRVWDAESGGLIATLWGAPESISALALSADGARVYAGSYRVGLAFPAGGGPAIARFDGHDDFVTAIAEAGGRVFVGSQAVDVYDAGRLQKLARLEGPTRVINELLAAADGASVYAVSDDGSVSRWDVASKQRSLLAKPSSVGALSAAFGPRGETLVVGMSDGTIRSYPVDGSPYTVSRIHSDWVTDVAVGPGGEVYSASRDRNVAQHTPGQGPRIIILAAHRAAVRRVGVLPNGTAVSSGDDGDVYLFAGEDLAIAARLPRSVEVDLGPAVELTGDAVGELRVHNGFRYPVEIRVGGKPRGVVAGDGELSITGLPLAKEKLCADDSECGAGEFCDYERDEPSCSGRTRIDAYRPGSEVRVFSGESFLARGKAVGARVPADEPFSVGAMAETPYDPRARVDRFVAAYPALKDRVLAKVPDAPEAPILPRVARALHEELGADPTAPAEAKELLTTWSQAKLNPTQFPVQPFRVREAAYHMMRPPKPSAKGVVLNDAHDTSMIIVSLHEPSAAEGKTRDRRIRDTLATMLDEEKKTTGYEYHVIGGVIMDTWMEDYARSDMETLLPFFIGVIATLLALIFRRASAVILPLGLVSLSVLIAMGAAAFMGGSMNNMTVAVPQVILASCIGDAVHIYDAYCEHLREGQNPHDATVNSIVENLVPCFWTSASTAIGFLSLATSPIQPVAMFGWMAGIGVCVAFLMSVMIMPAVTVSLPVPKWIRQSKGQVAESGFDRWFNPRLQGVIRWVNRSTATILFLTTTLLVAGLYGVSKVNIDTDSLRFFSADSPFRRGAHFVEDHISGSYNLQIMVDFGEAARVRQEKYIEQVAALQEFIETTPEVMSVSSISETLKGMNRVMNHDVDDNYRVPDGDPRISGYYNAYTFSLSAGLDITNRVSADEGATLLDVRLLNRPSRWVIAFGDRVNAWAATNTPDLKLRFSAKSWLYSNMVRDVDEGFIWNLGSAIGLIAIILFWLGRGFRIGIPAVIANVVPMVATIGFIAALGISLDISALVASCVALGIVVDDTTHFVAKYRRLILKGMTHEQAVTGTLTVAGKASILTTVVLVAGFSTLGFTDFAVNRNFGIVVCTMLTAGLLFDLFGLPALLALTRQRETAPSGAVAPNPH